MEVRCNVGSTDQKARIILGIVILLLSLAFFQSLLGPALVVSAILVATALFEFCPVYHLLGISTCKRSKEVVQVVGQSTKSKRTQKSKASGEKTSKSSTKTKKSSKRSSRRSSKTSKKRKKS